MRGGLDYTLDGARPPFGTQIDWGHPSADRLRHAFLFNDGGGPPVNSAGYVVTMPTLAAGATWARDSINYDGGTTAYVDTGTQSDLNVEMTVLVEFNIDSTASTRALFGDNQSNGTEKCGTAYVESTKLTFWQSSGSGTSVKVLTGAVTITAGTRYRAVITRSGANGAWTVTSYLRTEDGGAVQDATGTTATTINLTSIGSMRVGSPGAFAGSNFDGVIPLFCLWTRAMSPAEAFALLDDPYQLWAREELPSNFKASAAAAGNRRRRVLICGGH